ncbi:MAG TPA: extracellular solute-binding protein [Candidatus Paenibacillus intestinavium]|nr:extracellular solute-binding protein [Candidatus Paenibacillus intestinavium]
MRKLKNMHWIILYVILLATTIVYSIPKVNDSSNITETEKTTISFRHVWTLEHDLPMLNIFRDVVEKFEETHPNIKVNFEGLDQTYHREQKLRSEMITGTPPDMFVLFGGAELDPYVRANRLLNLNDFIAENELDFIDLSHWTYNDQVFGLPFEGHAQPLFYNKEIFKKLEITPPTTIDELNTAIDILNRNNYIPFTFGNKELWPGGVYAHYLMDRYAGPQLIEQIASGQASFNNGNYVKAFDQLQHWISTNTFNDNYSDIFSADAIHLFNEGKAAMYLNGNWDITLFQSPKGLVDFQDNIGVIAFPTLEKDEEQSIAGGYTIGIGLSANLTGLQRTAALELLKAFYTEEVQLKIVYEAARLPSMDIPFDVSQTGPVFAQVVELLEQSQQIFLAYDNILPPEVRKEFWTITDSLFKLEITSEEALQQLDQASQSYFQLINSYGGESTGAH